MLGQRKVGAGLGIAVLALLGARAEAQNPFFADPTADVIGEVVLGDLVYFAPFALLNAGTKVIEIGDEFCVQDSVVIDASVEDVKIREQVCLAHGATVKGPAEISEEGRCPGGAAVCPSFVGFNAVVDGATIQKDAMVLALARVGPGVMIPSGRKVLSGKNVTSQSQVFAKTAPVTAADRAFMAAVVRVNVAFAEHYPDLEAADPDNVRGINFDPDTEFNPGEQLPNLGCDEFNPGVNAQEPDFRNRIIGEICLADSLEDLDLKMGSQISLRADEGAPFVVGHIDTIADRTTFHALENEKVGGVFLPPDDPAAEPRVVLGDGGAFGYHSLVHAGAALDPTSTGDGVIVGDWSVLFTSEMGDNSRIGFRSLVQASSFEDGTVIESCEVWINNVFEGPVEWCNVNPSSPSSGSGG